MEGALIKIPSIFDFQIEFFLLCTHLTAYWVQNFYPGSGTYP